MADHEPPAASPGNADNSAETPPPLPERIRVHALAKLLGVTSKRLLAHLTEMGSEARTAHSSVNRDVAESVRESLTEAQQAPAEPAALVEKPAPAELAEPAAEVAPEAVPQPAEPEFATDVAHATLFSSPVVTEPAPVEEPVAPALQTPLFLPPETPTVEPRRRRRATAAAGPPTEAVAEAEAEKAQTEKAETAQPTDEDEDEDNQPRRRRRGRRGRGRGRGEQTTDEESTESEDGESESGESEAAAAEGADESAEAGEETEADEDEVSAGEGPSRRRRRRRRRKVGGETAGETSGETSEDDPPNTVVHEREPRTKARVKDEVQGITGSTRLEAKRQRRRDGRDAGRRRPPILSESEFLARREAVDRVMVVREKAFTGASAATGNVTGASAATGSVAPDLAATQVAVLEDGVLVEHFVTSVSSASIVGNVYRGRVQNVLPSMEAAFVDIGRGRNGVLYAGEVNWEAAGLGGKERKIEQALKPGDQVLVQVSKDPVGHKGARLTTQISLAGRFLVYVPGGSSTGISRKLPDTERKRLKEILREIVPADAGVIIRTASEGVSAEELAGDVERLQNQWHRIESDANGSGGNTNPQALYEEPDLLVKVVRDLFNEDFSKLVIEGDEAWNTIETYIRTVAPDLLPRVQRHESAANLDVFETHRIDEQLAKALERKVWLPSGGTLVIDRTEAMTVVDVNTGKFTGAGGNLEETVTRNNLEAAEEIVRQMRLRDIGGMIVVDFIDMVLESNRDLVLRRLTECLGRDRTRHQVSEVTSLGLVQMTRKKMGTGLVEAFSTTCEHCHGRGIVVHSYPVDASSGDDGGARGRSGGSGGGESGGRRRRGRDRSQGDTNGSGQNDLVRHVPEVDVSTRRQHPVALAMAAHHAAEQVPPDAEHPKVEEQVVAEAGEIPGAAADGETEQADSVGVEAVQVEAVDTVEGTSVEVAADVETVAVETVTVEAATAPVGDTTAPAASRRTGRRRVSRAAAAPEGDSSGTVVVVSAEEESGDGQPSEVATALRTASVTVPPRSRRRRASGRPAGPPVDVEA